METILKSVAGLSLTSVSVSNSKFSFLFCQTLTRSKKKRSWGRVSGAEFQKQSKHGETQMLALATLKAASHILFDFIDKTFSLNNSFAEKAQCYDSLLLEFLRVNLKLELYKIYYTGTTVKSFCTSSQVILAVMLPALSRDYIIFTHKVMPRSQVRI